jgi:uncharacterized RDD family membrane protein YckC
VYCPRCGARVPDDARFCPACGAAQPAQRTTDPSAPNVGAAPGIFGQTSPARVLPANISTFEAASGPVRYAGFWRRLGAVLIDAIILWLLQIAIAFGIGVFAGLSGASTSSLGGLLLIVDSLFGLLYYAIQESSAAQATFGKRALGIIVTDTQGRRVSFWRALGRYLAKILSTLIIFIGYVMVAFTARKQGLHDLLAGTLVMRGKPGPRRA